MSSRPLLSLLALAAFAAPASAEIYGDFTTRVESNANFYRRAYDQSYGYVKYIYGQAYFRNDERPGWFGGFLLMQERAQGQDPDTRGGDNDIGIAYFGKHIKTHWGHQGYETALGMETLIGFTARPRAYFQFNLNHSYYLSADIAYTYLGHHRRQHKIDKDAHQITLRTAIHYRRSASSGLFATTHWRPRVQIRSEFGNIIEEDVDLRLGRWQNFRRLYSTLWLELGRSNIFNGLDGSTFNRYNKYQLGARIEYEFIDSLRFIATLAYERQWRRRGEWVPGGRQNVDQAYFDLGLKHTF